MTSSAQSAISADAGVPTLYTALRRVNLGQHYWK